MAGEFNKLFDLKGKRALITGGSRGIGLACAQALSEFGAEVVITGRGERDLDQAIAAIGPGASAIVCDATDIGALAKLIEREAPFHVLVNNAGTNKPQPFVEVTEENYDLITDINVRALFFASQFVVRKMKASKIEGSIIHMSSQMGHIGSPNRSVYVASKHAVEGLTKAMAVELAPERIRVNSVAPTFIETSMTKPMLANQDFMSFVEKNIPLGFIGEPRDVAGAVVYLASDASRLVTGSCLKVDGGWTAQ